MTAFSSASTSNSTPEGCEAGAAARVVESLDDSASRVALTPTLVVADAELRQVASPETPPEPGAMLKRRDTKPEKTEKSGLQHAAQRRHGARCSVERCVQLLARPCFVGEGAPATLPAKDARPCQSAATRCWDAGE